MTQLTLFDGIRSGPHAGPLSRRTDPPGSYVAAATIKRSGQHASDKVAVLAALRLQRVPVTSKVLAGLMHCDRHMVARRLPDLEADELARRVGTAAVSRETLWQAT